MEISYNNQAGFLGATLDAPAAGTSQVITNFFGVAPNFATLVPPDYIKVVLDYGTGNYEIVYVTAYTQGSKNATVTRGAEDATNWPPVAHTAGTSTWSNGPTMADFGIASLGGPGVATRGSQLNTVDSSGNPRNILDDGMGNASVAGSDGGILRVGVQATVLADAAPALPLTVVTGVNDQFLYTSTALTTKPFTVAAGTYSTLDEAAAAMAAALGTTIGGSPPFSTFVICTPEPTSGKILLSAFVPGVAHNGDTITSGAPEDVSAALGFTGNPDTFSGGVDGLILGGVLTGTGSPWANSIAATYIGQEYVDLATGSRYTAVNLTPGEGWTCVGGGTIPGGPSGQGVFMGPSGTQGDEWTVVDSEGNTALNIDDVTDAGTGYKSPLRSASNTLDDGTVNALAKFLTTIILQGCPTSDPLVVGQVWNNGGVLNISAG
jgi:hypothetical protein